MPKQHSRQPANRSDGHKGEEKVRIAINTIVGGFAGGGESSSARRRYARRAEFDAKFVG
ncbi:hypothetical protein A2U01_0106739, partial [Trifolium medium]|nr:hypothetical protein [Trifolium medium]